MKQEQSILIFCDLYRISCATKSAVKWRRTEIVHVIGWFKARKSKISKVWQKHDDFLLICSLFFFFPRNILQHICMCRAVLYYSASPLRSLVFRWVAQFLLSSDVQPWVFLFGADKTILHALVWDFSWLRVTRARLSGKAAFPPSILKGAGSVVGFAGCGSWTKQKPHQTSGSVFLEISIYEVKITLLGSTASHLW